MGPPGRDGDDGDDPFPSGSSGNTKTITQLPGFPGGTSTFLRSDATFGAPTATVAFSKTTVAFTDGDSLRRVTITDGAMTATSAIVMTITRPDTTDANDLGWVYIANVVSRGTGTFDVLVACLDWGTDDPGGVNPNETITLNYAISA